jgi:hypothetical protein
MRFFTKAPNNAHLAKVMALTRHIVSKWLPLGLVDFDDPDGLTEFSEIAFQKLLS